MSLETRSYVLITPARNEEAFIEQTIQSVVGQTILPRKWVIVSDGSTDRTEEIVRHYCVDHGFIELVSSCGDAQRNFGSKVHAFYAGYEVLGDISYDFIGNIDADVSFAADYFENILRQFQQDSRLGIAGGVIMELIQGRYVSQNISADSVAGAVQLFRRQCFDDIGGYLPLPHGGIDCAAEVMARMHNWRVKTYFDYAVLHHRRVLTGGANIFRNKFRHGSTDFLLGYHPLFELFRCLYKTTQRPYVLGSLCSFAGFCWAAMTRQKKHLPDTCIHYLRKEQINKLLKNF